MIGARLKGANKVKRTLIKSQKNVNDAKKEFIRNVAGIVEKESKRHTPILSGDLKRSIDSIFSTDKAIIAPHTTYQEFVHEGTGMDWRKGRRPYMEQGLSFSEGRIARELRSLSNKIYR